MAMPIPKTSFSAGELDPVLHERTTLEKYKTGLATARNVVVSKTGSVLSRMGRFHFKECKIDDSPVVAYSPPGSGLILEWGVAYIRAYTFAGTLAFDSATLFTDASDIPLLHFETSGKYVYAFRSGKTVQKLDYTTGSFVADIGQMPIAPVSTTITQVGTPTGYSVQYAVSYVQDGQESLALLDQGGLTLPIAAGQENIVDALLITGSGTDVTEMKVYRRPTNGGAYGYIGSTSYLHVSAGNLRGGFVDLGFDADYAHQPPFPITPPTNQNPSGLLSKTGVIYQQRLLITDTTLDLEAIYASQPGFQNNFFRNFPLDNASALKFKSGTSGYARVLRMLDSDGLVAFTSAGIYLNQGELSPSNITLAKKGKWVVADINSAPPLAVPGGVLFIDASTNTIRNLLFDLYRQAFQAEEVSIYSEHLFRNRLIKSWNFQEGIFPLLWVVFTDGSFASFTFEFDQQMKAWTRHDSDPAIEVINSCGTINPDTTFFVVRKGTKRYLEYTISRYSPPAEIATDPENAMNPSIAYMDSMVSFATLLNLSLLGTDTFQLSTTTSDQDWTLPLNLTCGTSGVFTATGPGTVGTVFRYFDSDGSAFDLEVLSRTDSNNIIVQPNIEFPSDATGIRLYQTAETFTGLDHLEGEKPAVIVDGAVVCSPNNDVDGYPEAIVVGGSLTLPNDLSGAIVHIGRPIIGDVETLNIDTVEQAPTLIESLDVNKIYVKVHNSMGLFVGNKFPVNGNVVGMERLDAYDVDYTQDNPIIGNRFQPAATKRVELTLPGDWRSQGKVCFRQVDPLHFEILSIIPDCEVLRRSDR